MVAGNGPATSSTDPAMARTRVTPSAASAPTTSSISASLRTARAARWGTGTRPASWTRRAQATVPSKPALGSQVMKTAVPGARTRSRGGSLSSSRGRDLDAEVGHELAHPLLERTSRPASSSRLAGRLRVDAHRSPLDPMAGRARPASRSSSTSSAGRNSARRDRPICLALCVSRPGRRRTRRSAAVEARPAWRRRARAGRACGPAGAAPWPGPGERRRRRPRPRPRSSPS